MTDQWQTVAMPTSEASAQVLIGLLQSEGIPARLKANVPVPGLPLSFRVQVPDEQVRRAEEVLRSSQVTEEELTQLAVGTSPPDAT
jgi:hypothetical protein